MALDSPRPQITHLYLGPVASGLWWEWEVGGRLGDAEPAVALCPQMAAADSLVLKAQPQPVVGETLTFHRRVPPVWAAWPQGWRELSCTLQSSLQQTLAGTSSS